MRPHPHHSNKTDPDKSQSLFYGATNGIRLEKYCVEFAELSTHETELIVQIYNFLFDI